MQADDGDRWTICTKGHVHWGIYGGAGLLMRYVPRDGKPIYLLAQRSRSSVDEGGTWGMPGGALRKGESPVEAARREAREEIWPVPDYRVTGSDVQDCGGGWKFHVVMADVDEPTAVCCSRETEATGWFRTEDMDQLPLHPGVRRWLDEHSAPRSGEGRGI
jgi:8-oxo-dGTP diphosphatase